MDKVIRSAEDWKWHLAEVAAEMSRLRSELETEQSRWHSAENDCEAFQQEIERLRADARRYQWLRQQNAKGLMGDASIEIADATEGCVVETGHSPEELDRAIDERLSLSAGDSPK